MFLQRPADKVCVHTVQCAHRFPLRLSWIVLSLFCKLSNITLKVICTCVHCNIFLYIKCQLHKTPQLWLNQCFFLNSRNQSNHKAFLTVSKGICVVLFVGKKPKLVQSMKDCIYDCWFVILTDYCKTETLSLRSSM